MNDKWQVTAILELALLSAATPTPIQKMAFIYVKHDKAEFGLNLFIGPLGTQNEQ